MLVGIALSQGLLCYLYIYIVSLLQVPAGVRTLQVLYAYTYMDGSNIHHIKLCILYPL